MTKKKLHHGGDIGWAKAYFGHEFQDWIDLSTGINPTSYPYTLTDDTSFNSLPEQSLYEHCFKTACVYYGYDGDAENALLTPGSQILISQLPYLFEKSNIGIFWPTYGEHSSSWTKAGHHVQQITFDDTDDEKGFDILVIVNPNNPDGHLTPLSRIRQLADKQVENGGYLVVDEAFMDLYPENSAVQLLPHPAIIILKSFGKFFGLAGLRLGMIFGPEDIVENLNNRLGPWAVPSPILHITAQAFLDKRWINDQLDILKQSTSRLKDLLSKHLELKTISGTDLYSLIEPEDASRLFQHLGQHGIYVRHFDYNKNWLRFGLIKPDNTEHWERLDKALQSYNG